MKSRGKKEEIIGISLLILLTVPLTSAQNVTLREGVQINQPANNVKLLISEDINFSNLASYEQKTSLSQTNFTASPSGNSNTIVELTYFNATPSSEEKFADFNTSSNASQVMFSFSNLDTLGIYDVYANEALYSRPNATGTGSISFTYSDWSENMFEIFAGETLTADNVSITLTGDYADVVADDATRVPGTYTNLDYPYVAMEDSSKVEAVIATVNFKQLTYTQNGGKDVVSIRKGFDGGRFLLPANTGTHENIESREQLVMNNDFLSTSRPSFTQESEPEQTISIISDYDSINVSGDFVIDTGTASAINVESTSSSSFQDVVSGGNTSVRITGSN